MTVETSPPDYIVTDRSGIPENRHGVHAAIVDSTGTLLFSIGDSQRVTLLRSAAKPAQALAILETGCFEHFPELTDADLALACASHSSEGRHVERTRKMLRVVEAGETDLKCGGHASISEWVNREWIRRDYTPTAIDNNCSGKHAGMLAGCRALGADLDGYHLPSHPMQMRVRQVVEDLSGLEGDEVKWGIDGCNLPAPAMPLTNMGRIYATVAAAADAVSKNKSEGEGESEDLKLSLSRTQALSRIFHAMSQYPELVGGECRFCTELMRGYDGALIGKVGADGCYGVAVRASQQTRRIGAVGAIGIAVKIEDGNQAVLYSAVAEILERLQIGTPETREGIRRFHKSDILNTAGVVTGRYSHLFELQRVGA
ncbi:asparaginase [Aspergillus undulatus]|uniref:asparaginase n=1 Tax=Aspergillus undulatus TaxID=1810928 RepID=UPI003CCCF344